MNPASVDIKDLLEGESSLGLTFASNLFIGREPTHPDNVVTLFDTPGGPPQLTYDRTEKYYYPSVQVRVRNNSYLDGWDLIHNIREVLHGQGHVTINGTTYELIKCSMEPSFLTWDRNSRAVFVTTFDLQRR